MNLEYCAYLKRAWMSLVVVLLACVGVVLPFASGSAAAATDCSKPLQCVAIKTMVDGANSRRVMEVTRDWRGNGASDVGKINVRYGADPLNGHQKWTFHTIDNDGTFQLRVNDDPERCVNLAGSAASDHLKDCANIDDQKFYLEPLKDDVFMIRSVVGDTCLNASGGWGGQNFVYHQNDVGLWDCAQDDYASQWQIVDAATPDLSEYKNLAAMYGVAKCATAHETCTFDTKATGREEVGRPICHRLVDNTGGAGDAQYYYKVTENSSYSETAGTALRTGIEVGVTFQLGSGANFMQFSSMFTQSWESTFSRSSAKGNSREEWAQITIPKGWYGWIEEVPKKVTITGNVLFNPHTWHEWNYGGTATITATAGSAQPDTFYSDWRIQSKPDKPQGGCVDDLDVSTKSPTFAPLPRSQSQISVDGPPAGTNTPTEPPPAQPTPPASATNSILDAPVDVVTGVQTGVAQPFLGAFSGQVGGLDSGDGPLSVENKDIRALLVSGGRIASLPDGTVEYMRLVNQLTRSLASPDTTAVDSATKLGALLYKFSDATPDATPDITPDATPDITPGATPDITPGATLDITPGAKPGAHSGRVTYLPEASVDTVRRLVMAKSMALAGVPFKLSADESPGRPKYVFGDSQVGDVVRVTAGDEAGFTTALRSGVSELLKATETYVLPGEANVRGLSVIVDVSGSPAVKGVSEAKLDKLVDGVGREFCNGRLANVFVVFGDGTVAKYMSSGAWFFRY